MQFVKLSDDWEEDGRMAQGAAPGGVMMALGLGKVLSRGQVTLPRDVRKAADLKPGDKVSFRVTEKGVVEIRPLPQLRLEDTFEMWRIEGPIDIAAMREEAEAAAADEVIRRAMSQIDE
jgi:AbrB family looped-hinge helix DNA binding protein